MKQELLIRYPQLEKCVDEIEKAKEEMIACYERGGVGIGAFSTFISSKFTDESLILGIVAIFGTIVGIPLSRKFIKYYIWPDALNEEKPKIIRYSSVNRGLVRLRW